MKLNQKYFIYFKRVFCGKTVGQGTEQIILDKPIRDISQLNEIADNWTRK